MGLGNPLAAAQEVLTWPVYGNELLFRNDLLSIVVGNDPGGLTCKESTVRDGGADIDINDGNSEYIKCAVIPCRYP